MFNVIHIPYFLMGILSVLCWSVIWYLIKPKSYILVKDGEFYSRLQIVTHHVLAIFIVFTLLAIFVPKNGNSHPSNLSMSIFLFGIVSSVILLIYLGKNKISLKRKQSMESIDAQPTQPIQSIPQYKEPTLYVSPTESTVQPWNTMPSDDSTGHIHDEITLVGFRYVLDYKDRHGNITTRGIDITGVHKEYGNNRWYFIADTQEGERTFKSQRVIRLKDQWFDKQYSNAKEVREHLLSEYDVVEDLEY